MPRHTRKAKGKGKLRSKSAYWKLAKKSKPKKRTPSKALWEFRALAKAQDWHRRLRFSQRSARYRRDSNARRTYPPGTLNRRLYFD